MNQKNKVIIGLLAIATVLFILIQFWIIPAEGKKQTDYARNQRDALTHDITSIAAYQNPYVGNAANTSQLFYSLPLNQLSMKFEIDSERAALTVHYLDTVDGIGEEKVQQDLVYNGVAAMATIDNLTEITYYFSGKSYSLNRKQLEAIFGQPLASLLEEEKWHKEVQNKLRTQDFVQQFFD